MRIFFLLIFAGFLFLFVNYTVVAVSAQPESAGYVSAGIVITGSGSG